MPTFRRPGRRLLLSLLLLPGIVPAAAQEMGAEACLKPPYRAAETAEQRAIAGLVDGLRGGLAGFPSLRETLETAGPVICLFRGPADASGYFAPGENLIALHEDLSPAMRRVVLVHELRHLDQTARGACPGAELSRQSYAAAVQAMEADASAMSALVAWSWREAGHPEPWAALAEWPTQADIAARFAAVMDTGAAPHEAVAAAFDQWYESAARRESYWYSACSAYLDRQDESHALPRYGSLQDGFWADLCVMPDGQDYDCSERE